MNSPAAAHGEFDVPGYAQPFWDEAERRYQFVVAYLRSHPTATEDEAHAAYEVQHPCEG